MSDSIGIRIKDLREALQMSQRDLSIAAGITAPNLSRIEADRVEDLRWSTVSAISETLEVTPQYLMEGGSDCSEATFVDRSSDALSLVSYFRNLSSPRRKQLLDFAEFLSVQQKRNGK